MTNPATFIHLGDLHLCSAHPRNADRVAAARQAIADAKLRYGNTLAAWLWPGDIFHTKSTVEDRNTFASLLQEAAAVAPVVICDGNHDAPGDLAIFARLKAAHPVFVVSVPHVFHLALDKGQRVVSIFVLPYPNKARLVAAGVEHAALGHETTNAMDLLFMDAAATLGSARKRGEITLMIGHVTVAGAVSSVGQPQIGGELEITEDHLARLGPIYKGLNHIHKAQAVGGAHYAGSLCRLDWGEAEPKGYMAVTYEADGYGWKFVPLNIPPMCHIECTIEDGARELTFTGGPRDGEWPDTWAGCDVRVRINYQQGDRRSLEGATNVTRDKFKAARRLEIEPVVIPNRPLRAPEVMAAQTLDEKLQAWAQVSGVAWSAEIATCADRLQAGEPDAVVADVTARLERIADVAFLSDDVNQLTETIK